MKIIDTHTHFPGTAFGLRPKSGEQLRSELESEGLSGAWIMTTDGLLKEPARHNDLLANGVAEHLDFFVPFCTVSPHDGEDAAVRELERSANELGMKGLKLHPWLQAFSLTHPAVIPILQKAGELDMPVLFHDGSPPYSTPLQIAAAAEKVPGTTIVLGHAGLDDLYNDAILACLGHSNIYLCLCSISAGYMKEIIQRCPAERLLFGSDAGFFPNLARQAIVNLNSTLAPKETLSKIAHENAERIMRLNRRSS